jgi:hypothetical protein
LQLCHPSLREQLLVKLSVQHLHLPGKTKQKFWTLLFSQCSLHINTNITILLERHTHSYKVYSAPSNCDSGFQDLLMSIWTLKRREQGWVDVEHLP